MAYQKEIKVWNRCLTCKGSGWDKKNKMKCACICSCCQQPGGWHSTRTITVDDDKDK